MKEGPTSLRKIEKQLLPLNSRRSGVQTAKLWGHPASAIEPAQTNSANCLQWPSSSPLHARFVAEV
jgi:hypothetical protein